MTKGDSPINYLFYMIHNDISSKKTSIRSQGTNKRKFDLEINTFISENTENSCIIVKRQNVNYKAAVNTFIYIRV